MRMSTTYIPRLAGLQGVNPHEISGRVVINGEPVIYAKALLNYKGKTWIVSDDQDFVINNLGAPVGAIINGVLVPLDRMTDAQHAQFQPKYGYKRIPVSASSGPDDGRLGFGIHLPHISIPHPHISLPSKQQLVKVGTVAAGAAALYFSGGAAALAKAAVAYKMAGGGGGAPAPDTGAAPSPEAMPVPEATTPAATPRPAAPPQPAWMKWALMAGAALLIL